MLRPLRVLLVEDSAADARLVLRELSHGFDVTPARVDTPAAMEEALSQETWDVVIADFYMPRFSGLAALRSLKDRGIDLPFILVSGVIGEDTAVAAMKAGAHDYIMKDNLSRLVPAVEREVREAEVRRDRRRAEQAREEERERIAMDLHDGVIQSLYALGLELGAHRRVLDSDPGIETTRDVLRLAQARLNDIIREARTTVFRLRQHEHTLGRLCAGLNVLASGLQLDPSIRIMADLPVESGLFLALEIAENVLHVAHEAMSNVVRHAVASEVAIRLAREGDTLVFSVRDDGRGFQPTNRPTEAYTPTGGQGLGNMAERARLLGGQFSVVTAPGAGTEIRLVVPIRERR